jgi:hypothetical protein
LLRGRISPPPGAGPNWVTNHIKTLENYAKKTKRRHKKHEKRMRKAAEAAAGGRVADFVSAAEEEDRELRTVESA